jgi:hypothetical protein
LLVPPSRVRTTSIGGARRAAIGRPAESGCGFSAASFSAQPDAAAANAVDPEAMRQTYAVTWSTPGGAVHAGRLELRPDGLMLRGGSGCELIVERLAYEDLRAVRRARTLRERVRGRTSLVLELFAGGAISIASVGQPGALTEVAERLAAAG